MVRPIWSGNISFGLLNIPVVLISTKTGRELHFNLLDRRDHAHIGYRAYNKSTGKDVDKRQIVKGFEFEPDQYVIVTNSDFEKANPKAVKTIEIQDFVNLEEMDPLLFERPYYLLPSEGAEKGYALLVKILDRSKRLAIGKMVLHRKQRLVAIMVRGQYLVCEVLRYQHEIYTVEKLDEMAGPALKKIAPPTKREIEVGEQLVNSMTAHFNGEKYKDEYYSDMLKLIRSKAKGGKLIQAAEPREESGETASNIVDLMPLLKRSLQAVHGEKKKKGSAKKRTGHKGAG